MRRWLDDTITVHRRFAARGADAGPFALVAMREHDEAAIPVGRHADQVFGASNPPLIVARRIGSAGAMAALAVAAILTVVS